MKLADGRIDLLFNEDGLHICLYDESAVIQFVEIRLNREQTCMAMSRLSRTPCSLEVRGLDKVGKKRLRKILEFPLPTNSIRDRKKVATEEADKLCPEGWVASHSFNSQGSFFRRDGQEWATTNIFKWVDTGIAP